MRDVENITFGIDTFGDLPRDDQGEIVSHAQAIRAVVHEAVLADEIGIDAITVGEHHRPDYAVSSPDTVLAGIATVTKRIQLGSGVTVLSSGVFVAGVTRQINHLAADGDRCGPLAVARCLCDCDEDKSDG